MSYDIQIHKVPTSPYTQSPAMYVTIHEISATRSGQNVYVKLNLNLKGLGGSSYFGFSIDIYAKIDDNEPVKLIHKDGSLTTWKDGDYKYENTLSYTMTKSYVDVKLFVTFGCGCSNSSHPNYYFYSNRFDVGPSTYEVKFLSNYSPESVKTVTGYFGSKIVVNNNNKYFNRTNYNFTGWSTTRNKANIISSGDHPIEGNATFFATWDRIVYTVTLHNEYGNPKDENRSVNAGDSTTLPILSKSITLTYNLKGGRFVNSNNPGTTVTKSFKFNGWTEGSRLVSYTYTPGKNVKLNASWTLPTIGVLPQVSKDGYIFSHWSYDTNGTKVVKDSDQIDKNTTIYAQYVTTRIRIYDGTKWVPWIQSATVSNVNNVYKYENKKWVKSGSVKIRNDKNSWEDYKGEGT